MCGFISGPSILVHWSMCLFLCHYCAVLISVALQCSQKSGWAILPALFFFLTIALAVWGLFWFCMNFRIICSNSVKNFMGLHCSCVLLGLYFEFISFKGRKKKRSMGNCRVFWGAKCQKPLWVSIACNLIHEAFQWSSLILVSTHQSLHK